MINQKNSAADAVERLRYMKLTAGSKRIASNLGTAKLIPLLSIKAGTLTSVQIRLCELKRPVADEAIVAAIMAAQKGGVSEGDFVRLFEEIRLYYTSYKLTWLNAARDLCRILLEAQQDVLSGSSGAKNIVGRNSYPELIAHGIEELRVANAYIPTLFRHGSTIARVVEIGEEDSARVELLSRDAFGAVLPASFRAPYGDNSTIEIAPPPDVVRAIYHRSGDLPLPYLCGVSRVPCFGKRGELVTAPGYSSATFSYYVPPNGLEIPRVGDRGGRVSADDVWKAARLIVVELLGDFPFDGWNRARIEASLDGSEPLPASLLNAVAVLIEPFVRSMIGGPTPGVLVSKPSPATGATFLCEAVQIVVAGASSVRPPLSRSEEERRKVLFTAIKGQEPLILFDNQTGALDSPTLASVLTSRSFTDRELGRSEERSLPIRSTVAFTSNNALFSNEILRRLSLIRLDSGMADPKTRTDWRHADLLAWVETNRGELIAAVLTLVQNWVQRGCLAPKHCPAVASYIGWSYVLGGILETVGPSWSTFQSNRDRIAILANAGEEEGIDALIAQWVADGYGDMTSAELAAVADGAGIELDGVRVGRDGSLSTRALGRYLASLQDRRFIVGERELALESSGERNHSKLWRLREVGKVETKNAAAQPATGPRVPAKYRHFPLEKRPAASWPQGGGGEVIDPFRSLAA